MQLEKSSDDIVEFADFIKQRSSKDLREDVTQSLITIKSQIHNKSVSKKSSKLRDDPSKQDILINIRESGVSSKISPSLKNRKTKLSRTKLPFMETT